MSEEEFDPGGLAGLLPCLCGAKEAVCDECEGTGLAQEQSAADDPVSDGECDDCDGEGTYTHHDEDCPAHEGFAGELV